MSNIEDFSKNLYSRWNQHITEWLINISQGIKASFNYSKNVFFIIFSLSFEVLFSVDRAKITSMENPGQRRPFSDHPSVGTWAENVCSFATPPTLPVFKLVVNAFCPMFLLLQFETFSVLVTFCTSFSTDLRLLDSAIRVEKIAERAQLGYFCHHLLKKTDPQKNEPLCCYFRSLFMMQSVNNSIYIILIN